MWESRRPWRRDSISRPSTMRNWTNWEGSCRQYILPRDSAASKVRGWIRGETKIGPALEMAVSQHQGRCGIEIMIDSSFCDGTCSWVVIGNGLNKYVTEMSEETQGNHIDDKGDSLGKFVAKARPKQTSMPTTTSPTVTLPYHQRWWIDVEPGSYDKSCFEVSQKMIRLLRHDPSELREEDGAVEVRILAAMFHSKFTSSPYWSIQTWLILLQRGGGAKKIFCIVRIHTLLTPSCTFEQFKATLKENTLILHCKTTCCY